MIRVLGAGTACLLLSLPAAADTLPDSYSSLWVFGDSLSDPGNIFERSGGASPSSYPLGGEPTVDAPYFRGRYSDDFVFADYLTMPFEAEGLAYDNYAYGGARAISNETGPEADDVPDFPAQIDMFEAEALTMLGDRPLAQILFGGNDIFAAARSDDPVGMGSAAAGAVLDGLERLYDLGIRDFALGNVADVGTTPLYNVFVPTLRASAETAVATFNDVLSEGLTDLDLPGSRTTLVDRFGFYETLQADPSSIGVTEVRLPCFLPSDAATDSLDLSRLCEDPTSYFFFDQVHPSGAVHAAYADRVERAILAPIPLPASGVLFLVAIGALGGIRRRRASQERH